MSSRNRDIARILGKTEAANPNNTRLKAAGGSTAIAVYSSLDSLPTTSLTAGDQAYVSANSRLYVSNGSGWYNVAIVNATPTLSLSSTGTIELASDGSTTTVIRLTGTDSDNADANLVYSIESGGDFFKLATIVQDSAKQYTITPRTEDSATALGFDGSATITFKASDGVNQATVQNTFTLAFTTDWATVSTTEVVLTPSGIGNSDRFGYDHFGLSTDGTYLVVGAAQEDTTNSNQGKAWVFKYGGSSWSEETTLFPPSSDNKANLRFGTHADISGDGSVAIISAANYGTYTGAVYVYTRSGTTWSYRTRLTASDAADYDSFGGEAQGQGVGISKDGTYIIVGSHQDDDGGSNRGSAYVFTGSGASWSQQQKLAPSYTSGNSIAYGNAVVINNDGTYCAIAAKNMNKNGTSTNTGVVFIYTRSGSTWTEQAYVSPSDGAASDNFGWHISMNGAGDRLLVHSRFDDDGGDSTGSIYVYTRSGSTWTQAAKLTKTSPTAYDYWGKCSINETGDVFVTFGDTASNSVAGSGKLYVYKDNSSGTDGTSWSLIKTLTTGVSETWGLGNDYGTVKMSRDTSTIVNTAGMAPNGTQQGRAYVFKA